MRILIVALLILSACAKVPDEQQNNETQVKHDCEQSQPGIVNEDC